MNKQIFFMAGLPRSGGTLISSILNQNPQIYVSPNSVLANIIGSVYNQYKSNENLDVDQRENIYSVLDGIIPLFYEAKSEKYIVDKNFYWLDRHLYSVLEKHLKNEIRVVCPVRNVMNMIASWNRMCEADSSNTHDIDMLERDRSDRPMPDKRADYFMNGNRMIEKIVNLKAFMNSVPENIMLVDYDDLVAEPYRVIGSIYDFLRIPYYDHFFDGLTTPHNYTDRWGVKNQHTVKSSIKKEQYDIEKLFSQETISRYSNLEFWKQQS